MPPALRAPIGPLKRRATTVTTENNDSYSESGVRNRLSNTHGRPPYRRAVLPGRPLYQRAALPGRRWMQCRLYWRRRAPRAECLFRKCGILPHKNPNLNQLPAASAMPCATG
eukprot:365942-Chlamydomonas_euryale.AAC.76